MQTLPRSSCVILGASYLNLLKRCFPIYHVVMVVILLWDCCEGQTKDVWKGGSILGSPWGSGILVSALINVLEECSSLLNKNSSTII